MKREYVIDPDFLRITVPFTEVQQAELEKSILEEGCLEPISVWNNKIIDGHKRYEFCSFEEIDYEVKEHFFTSKENAVSWACEKRLKGLNKSTAMYTYLTGKWYRSLRQEYKEMINAGLIEDVPQDEGRGVRVTKVMERDLGVGYSVIENRINYAYCMDKIAAADPDIFRAILTGQIYVSQMDVRKLAKRNRSMRNKVNSMLYPTKNLKERERGPKEEESGIVLSTEIKNMPKYDPDMEISGLALTIPTWMGSIARAERKTDMNLATDHAKRKLAVSLMQLEEQIQKTLEALK